MCFVLSGELRANHITKHMMYIDHLGVLFPTLLVRFYKNYMLSKNSFQNKMKEILVGNFLNLMTFGKITFSIICVILIVILHRYFGANSNGSTFFIIKAIFETSFQINPFLTNSAFRYLNIYFSSSFSLIFQGIL